MRRGFAVQLSLCVAILLGGTACQSPSPSPNQKGTATEETPGNAIVPFAVQILPVPPRAQGDLTVIVERRTTAPMEEFEYRWMKNGREISGKGSVLPHNYFVRGDVISVVAKSLKTGKEYMSSPVTIVNSPPAVTSATLLPFPIRRDEKARVEVTATDADGDGISYRFTWKRNNQTIPGATEASLDISHFAIGDTLEVTVRPRDSWEEGAPVHLPVVTIPNGSPRITSQPPSRIGEDGIYRYKVTATDPEGDPITFSLSSAPPGATIDPVTGLLTWRVSAPEKEEEFVINIQVSDTHGETSTQKFPVRVHPLTSQRAR